jgi:hypothetical protein
MLSRCSYETDFIQNRGEKVLTFHFYVFNLTQLFLNLL